MHIFLTISVRDEGWDFFSNLNRNQKEVKNGIKFKVFELKLETFVDRNGEIYLANNLNLAFMEKRIKMKSFPMARVRSPIPGVKLAKQFSERKPFQAPSIDFNPTEFKKIEF